MGSKKQHTLAFLIIGVVVIVIGLLLDTGNFGSRFNKKGYDLKLIAHPGSENWYYEVYYNGNLQIRQEYVPGVSKKIKFASRKEAEQIGKLVVKRLKNNLLPIVTERDLVENGISY